ncbi:MAG: hypothetical protein ISR96_13175 [Nitrospira sp.]|nr:hypothetical protein [bacterium]MBL7050459.1 hypothetical protein [Nitrospira sp.]
MKSHISDLIIGEAGYLIGGVGDNFFVSGNFENYSMMNTQWNTYDAMLAFTSGADTLHELYVAGTDQGALVSGYSNNFSWGYLDIAAGNFLNLNDGNLDVGGAMYVGSITGVDLAGLSVTNVSGNGMNIYYDTANTDNTYLQGLTYELAGGGQLIGVNPAVAPEPVSTALMVIGGLLLGGRIRSTRKTRNQ